MSNLYSQAFFDKYMRQMKDGETYVVQYYNASGLESNVGSTTNLAQTIIGTDGIPSFTWAFSIGAWLINNTQDTKGAHIIDLTQQYYASKGKKNEKNWWEITSVGVGNKDKSGSKDGFFNKLADWYSGAKGLSYLFGKSKVKGDATILMAGLMSAGRDFSTEIINGSTDKKNLGNNVFMINSTEETFHFLSQTSIIAHRNSISKDDLYFAWVMPRIFFQAFYLPKESGNLKDAKLYFSPEGDRDYLHFTTEWAKYYPQKWNSTVADDGTVTVHSVELSSDTGKQKSDQNLGLTAPLNDNKGNRGGVKVDKWATGMDNRNPTDMTSASSQTDASLIIKNDGTIIDTGKESGIKDSQGTGVNSKPLKRRIRKKATGQQDYSANIDRYGHPVTTDQPNQGDKPASERADDMVKQAVGKMGKYLPFVLLGIVGFMGIKMMSKNPNSGNVLPQLPQMPSIPQLPTIIKL